MTEGLVARGFDATLIQREPEILSALDPELGSLVTAEVRRHGATVLTGATVVHEQMRTGVSHVRAAGGCVVTHQCCRCRRWLEAVAAC